MPRRLILTFSLGCFVALTVSLNPSARGQGFEIDLGRVIGGIAEEAARGSFERVPVERFGDMRVERIGNEVRRGINEQTIRDIGSAAIQILSESHHEQYHQSYCDGRGSQPQPIVRPDPGSPAEQHFLKAQVALKNRNYVTAIKHAEKAAELLPENHDIQQLRSLIYFAQGRYRESASVAYTALHLGPGWNWKTIHKLMGSTEHYSESYEVLGKAAKNSPDSIDYHFLLGYHYLMLGHVEAGRKEMQVVDKLIPGDRLVTNILHALPVEGSIAAK